MMSTSSAPAASQHPTSTALPARASMWLSVPAGATLRAECGRITLTTAPVMCGEVLLTHTTPFALDAGHGWTPQVGTGAVWVQISNAGTEVALVEVTETSPAVDSLITRPLITLLAWAARWLKRHHKAQQLQRTTRC